MQQSKIEWTEMSWNTTTGCDKLSAGCKNCYAEVMSKRLRAMGQEKYRNGFKLTLHPETLAAPYFWKGRKKVFVNSMSDLFHEDVPLEYIQEVFKVMNDTRQHTYQILTKRADILYTYNEFLTWTDNIWMGVSVEDHRVTDRIKYLSMTNAHIKFLSLEPLIGPLPNINLQGIDWIIAGGESGHHARPIRYEWVETIQQQCKTAGILFFFKQWGAAKYNPNPNDPTLDKNHPQHSKGGCQLNGNVYWEMPDVTPIA